MHENAGLLYVSKASSSLSIPHTPQPEARRRHYHIHNRFHFLEFMVRQCRATHAVGAQ